MSRLSVHAAALLSLAACTEPLFGKAPPDTPLQGADAGALGAPSSLVDAGTSTPQPLTPPPLTPRPVTPQPQGGPAKPGVATPAVRAGFRTASQPRSAGGMTLQEDGFDTGDLRCVDKLCATGRFEP